MLSIAIFSAIPGPESAVPANLPEPPGERGGWLFAIGLVVTGGCVLAFSLGGLHGHGKSPAPAIAAATPTPAVAARAGPVEASGPTAIATASATAGETPLSGRMRPPTRSTTGRPAIVATRPSDVQAHDLAVFERRAPTHVPASWVAAFYPLYSTASVTFGVNWLLLASVHEQETAFSTAPGTYHGLNFARCCGGPMQFNVTNGPVTTWALVRSSYIYAARPAGYPHPTTVHPSIYDDFDALMAASRLLETDGASEALDDRAWVAAYDYYGNDPTGVTYADQVLARAIGWSQHGFCVNCGLDSSIVAAVHAAYGAPVLAELAAEAAARRAAGHGTTGPTATTGPTGT